VGNVVDQGVLGNGVAALLWVGVLTAGTTLTIADVAVQLRVAGVFTPHDIAIPPIDPLAVEAQVH
jgi:hypothetical protein